MSEMFRNQQIRRAGLLAIAAVAVAVAGVGPAYVRAAEPTTLKLWQEGAPGTPATKPADEPVLYVSTPTTKAPGVPTGVVVLPGGGYGHLAMDHEGTQIAEWLNSMGITAFVLKYRMSTTGHHHPVPMMDGQRAIRTARSLAKEMKLDPNRIGVIGFSAGGHLASTLGTHFDDGDPSAKDPIDRLSSRPDFLMLCYPVISFTLPETHKGSRKNLLGDNPDPELVKNLSNETQVTKNTPPTFIFQTSEDTVVPSENAVAFYLALHKAKVPAELHVFEVGKHGTGLAKEIPGSKEWPNLAHNWLENRGLLKP